jgi:formylglycine-generating enzyme required for sulfatase activity
MTPSVGRFCFLLASARLACSCQTVGESTIDAREPKGVANEVVNSIGMKFAMIPPGEFLMGSPESEPEAYRFEKPQHRVRITEPFYLGVHEVTIGQFRRFVDAAGRIGQRLPRPATGSG